ncbi:proline-rich transmembrane protein 4 [Triplophysa rosa]|uniref:Proline-rich transmembrane protein 4 n=1 Tax=Triplophysa rosa TaxID=992332 RepID=A0A9W7WB87_TRIRA|nr:proline-rich transmembrane protein 4 [Triplophysa rosa]KAI7791718.1 putative proline-rich transmembrane protein 4 [Triplophysa rosa]
MPLLRGTLAVVALLCLSGTANGFFSGFGPKPTPQVQAKEKGWGIPYMGKFPSFGFGSWGFLGGDIGQKEPDTAMGNPILPEATTQNYTPPPLLDESTSPRYQLTTTTTERVQSNIVQLGTPLPLKSAQLPTNELLRNTQGLDRPTSFSNYDLDLWPPNNAPSTEKTPQTTSPLITQPQTQTSNAQTSTSRYTTETRNVYSHQTITTETPSTTTTEHKLLTTSFQTTPLITPANLKPELSTEPLTTTTTKPEQNILGTEQTTTEPNWTQFKPTDKALDGFILAEQTTGPREEEKFQSTGPELSSTLPTGGLAREEGDSGIRKSADLATQEPHEQTTSSSTTRRNTEMPTTPSEDWLTDFTQESALPDCNAERSGICSSSDAWPTTLPSNGSKNDSTPSTNHSQNPIMLPMPPMLVALHSDWNSALATWGSAWEAHIYGLGTVFCLVALASTLNLLCLPLQYPSGCGYFALVSLSLVAAGCSRAFALVYDAYGYQDRMASTEASLLLYEAPYPCMTAAFGLVFLLLSMRSRMQLSYSAFQRPCILACLVLLHFAAAFGPVALLHVDQQGALYLFLSLISRGAFVALATFLSVAYFVFYCYVHADSKHIYHLNNTSPTPAERYNRCPFAESRDWDRAAAAVLLSAVFSLACAGLQLYAMLHALGLAGSAEAFRPWPWWTFQFSCRVCEAVVCLTLVLVVAQPVYCSDHLPQPGGCWTGLLAAKSPIIPGSYQWTLSQQEKLAICDPIGHGETECLPLYTLVDERLGSLNGLELLYHSNRALAYRDLDLDLPNNQPNTGAPSGGSSCTSDSTADLRPPSPINLRRSIDEALFSESLFPMSLFSPLRPFAASNRSLNGREINSTLRDTLMPDPGLYRTSSCVEVLPLAALPSQAQQGCPSLGFPPSPSPSLSSSTCCSSPERWKGSSSSSSIYRQSLAGSSLVLCSSPEEYHHPPPSTLSGSSNRTTTSRHQEGSIQRPYRTLNSQESLDQQSEFDQSVQEEFISVCRQIDSLSICSETIDL